MGESKPVDRDGKYVYLRVGDPGHFKLPLRVLLVVYKTTNGCTWSLRWTLHAGPTAAADSNSTTAHLLFRTAAAHKASTAFFQSFFKLNLLFRAGNCYACLRWLAMHPPAHPLEWSKHHLTTPHFSTPQQAGNPISNSSSSSRTRTRSISSSVGTSSSSTPPPPTAGHLLPVSNQQQLMLTI